MIESRKEKIKASIAFIVIALIVLIAGTIILKYSVEGEKNMPFKLSKIYLISTAEGVENKEKDEKWNFNIYQNNDIYFTIEKNKDYDVKEKIQSVQISNIKVIKNSNKGKIKVFMPNSTEGRQFSYEKEYILENNSLTYEGGTKTDIRNLNIGNQGGQIVIRFSNTDLGTYISNEDEEIKHDGTLLKKVNVENEDLDFTVSFDLIINIKNKAYKTSMKFDFPTGNIIETGTESIEITDMEEYVFKRI